MNQAYRLLLGYALAVYVILICIVGVLGYVTYEAAREAAAKESAQAWLVDSAGRQRMLAQRLAKECVLLATARTAASRARWRAAARATDEELIRGYRSVLAQHRRQPASFHLLRGPGAIHKDAERRLAALEPVARSLERVRERLNDQHGGPPFDAEALATLLADTERYVRQMDGIVGLLAEETQQRFGRLGDLLRYLAVPLLVVLLLVTVLLFWPLVRRLRASHAALGAMNERLVEEARERQQLVTVVEQSAEGILICEPDTRIRYVNPAFERITGWRNEDAAGLTPRILQSGRTDRAVYEDLWRTIQAGLPWRGELTDARRDGTHFEAEVSITPIFDGDRLQGYVGLTRDVTREKELEAQLRRAQKLEAIGALAGGIAHDFNNLLTPIMGYTELTLKHHAAGTAEHEGLTRVLSAARRAQELVRQILAFSRQGGQTREAVPMGPLVEEVAKLLRSTAPVDVTLEVHVTPGLDPAEGSATQFHTVVLNLCVNALQAMPDGGRLSLYVDAAQPDEAGAPKDLPSGAGLVCVTVQDTGVGMDPETRERIFDPFFTTKPVGQGTGLGLSTVYGIVTQHGGAVTVSSTPGKGTEFHVYLPTFPARRCADARGGDVDRPLQPGRILLVDDEPDIARLASDALEAAGHRVRMATDSGEAWEWFRADPHTFDLVITDLSMPQVTGFELMQRIHGLRPDLPVILVSGHETVSDDVHPRPGHRRPRFLPKPYSIEALQRVVAEQLGI